MVAFVVKLYENTHIQIKYTFGAIVKQGHTRVTVNATVVGSILARGMNY